MVFARVGQAGAGAVDDFDGQAVPELSGLFSGSSGGATQAGQGVQRQAVAGLAIGSGAFGDASALLQGEERLDLADDFTAGASGFEHLVEKAKEGAAHRIDPIAAVGSLVRLSQQRRGQERAKELLEVREAVLAEVADAPAESGQAGAEGGEEGRMHTIGRIYTASLDSQLKMTAMTQTFPVPPSLQRRYRQLARRLAEVGFITQGSVFERNRQSASGSRYQWTWKDPHQKTRSLTLSQEQYRWLKQALANQRQVEETLQKMRRITQRILLTAIPGTPRRKPLNTKVLPLN